MKNLPALLGQLADESQRPKVAGQIAKELGAEHLIIFIKDVEIDILLPAAGFVQTLQDIRSWQNFLASSIKKKVYYGTLPYPHREPNQAIGIAYKDECVAVLLGRKPEEQKLESLREILPLLASVFQHEQHKLYSEGQLQLTDSSLAATQEMAHKLDATRRELHTILTQYRSIFESTSDAIMIINYDGYLVEINPACHQMHGYTYEEMIGLNERDFVHPDDHHKFLDFIKTVKAGKVFTADGTHVKKDGTPISIEVVGSGFTYKGQPHLLAVVRSVSERKKAEEALRREYETKQRMELVTEQRNALVKVNKTKDEFIALASHQLRTPATVVKQYIALILSEFAGPLTLDQLQYLQIAYDSNERELDIINDLLKTAQIDSSKYRLNKVPSDIVAIAQESIADLRSMFERIKQTVVVEKPQESIQVPVDAIEIKLVFMNLLENASKYSYPGTEINVAVYNKGTYAEIVIADTGVGINRDNQQRIFDKFTRVDNELSDTVSGTGLGLYWVKRIVEEHKGSVKLTSKIGKGSKFAVRLPL